ncbi:uncharacterized protein PAN0_001c0226 [Moesziomyces antarcticus]|uniref:Uncharacterized protein n=1 Tax=Pseudozyma antarctica TaxID=84753 RepID=A0A5C3FFT1_PSEA2|nr:uncharacterized protein PAN0_001c0226 [Moesziomyces antarcticus]GAK62029.1 conserved hypothetical protein [Moesziomyces antarcticus]SPO42557.1 uncharacterized protein PSANT_00240 [Moesziomyces antarcticus]
MVLQNKYKAKASRRYNSQKGEANDAEAGSSKPGYRQRFANKHRRSASAGGGPAEEESESGSGEDDEDHSGDSEDDDKDKDFPSLANAASGSQTNTASEDDPSNPTRGKYARRRLGESKLARLERLEAAKDPRLPDDEEPEPEVDISNLVARVAAMGDLASTQAGLAEQIARSRAQNETASDVENDIDHSLAYLHERERQRQKAKGRGGADGDEASKHAAEALAAEADGEPIDLEALRKEKEKADAVRVLKARFQGHGVGEKRRPDAKPRVAPSIQIGPHAVPQSPADSDVAAAATASTLSPGLTAEIESALAKTTSGETASVGSGRSSFSTTFGRRRSPLAGVAGTEQERGSAQRTERIDSFLASINDRSVHGGRDPSVFSLSPQGGYTAASRSASYRDQKSMTPHSSHGELGRLENFLDDMLG